MTPLSLTRVMRPAAGWYGGDFHCHTHHSDGVLSPPELLETARHNGLDFFAITDHNTTAAFAEFGESSDVLIIPGLEVTFDHGHFNVFGIEHALPWSPPFCPGPTEIDLHTTAYDLGELVKAAAAAGLVTSINHPLMPPWSWADPDTVLTHVHCVEIWNDPSWPDSRVANPAAVAMWTEWLNAGHRITAVGGSDFHRPQPRSSQRFPEALGRPRTMVYARELSGQAILEGLRQGRAYMTMGPQIAFWGEWNGTRVEIGHDLGAVTGPLTLSATVAGGYEGRAMLVRNGEIVAETHLTGGPTTLHYATTLDPQTPAWFRLDVHATAPHGTAHAHPAYAGEPLWAITNPIYSGPRPAPRQTRYGDFIKTPVIQQAADRLQWPQFKRAGTVHPIPNSPATPYREG